MDVFYVFLVITIFGLGGLITSISISQRDKEVKQTYQEKINDVAPNLLFTIEKLEGDLSNCKGQMNNVYDQLKKEQLKNGSKPGETK